MSSELKSGLRPKRVRIAENVRVRNVRFACKASDVRTSSDGKGDGAMTYLATLLKAQAAGLIRPGEVAIAQVAHDSDCPATNGDSVCRCSPVVTLIANGRVIRLDDDGNAIESTLTT